MKLGTLAVTALLVVSAPFSVRAQEVSIQAVDVELGASRTEVIRALEASQGISPKPSCQDATEAECDTWVVMRGDAEPYDGLAGGVTFQDGVVVRASRSWHPHGETSQEAAVRSVVGALRSLLGSRATEICLLTERSNEQPGLAVSTIDVKCEERTVSVHVHRYEGEEGFTISEYVEDEEAVRGEGDSR